MNFGQQVTFRHRADLIRWWLGSHPSKAQHEFVMLSACATVPDRAGKLHQWRPFQAPDEIVGCCPQRKRVSGATLRDVVAGADVGGWSTPALRPHWTPTLECL